MADSSATGALEGRAAAALTLVSGRRIGQTPPNATFLPRMADLSANRRADPEGW
jgi:hypothetical protein